MSRIDRLAGLREKIKELEFKVPVPIDGEIEARYIHLEDRGIDRIVAKAREAVEGAGLTDDEIDAVKITQDDTDELEEMATIGLTDCEEDHREYAKRVPYLLEQRLKIKVAEANTKAILKALGVNEMADGAKLNLKIIMGSGTDGTVI